MQNSDFSLRRLGVCVLVGITAALGLDAAVFRSDLYRHLVSSESIAGSAFYMTHFERQRAPNPDKDVLTTGDSRMAEGFSARLANEATGDRDLHFVQGAIGGTSARGWYYMLKTIDPQANRYRAIVLSVSSYRRIPPGEHNMWDRQLDADTLMPILSFGDSIDLARSFRSTDGRWTAWSRVALAATSYRMDFQDFLLHPRKRLAQVKWRHGVAERYALDYNGHAENMDGLAQDPVTGDLSFPARLSEGERNMVKARFTQPLPLDPEELDSYMAYWFGRICERYRDSHTRIFIARMPSSPLPVAFHEEQLPMANFIEAMAKLPNVTVLPENAFLDLEAPPFFFDTNHLNAEGRKRMTSALVQQVGDTLLHTDSMAHAAAEQAQAQ